MKRIGFLALGLLIGVKSAFANEYSLELQELARKQISQIVTAREFQQAIKIQNLETINISQSEINALDRQWKRETGASERPLVDHVMNNELSEFLALLQRVSDGLLTEVFVMDARGLNVAQSSVTSDYWQGDEAKWQQTFKVSGDAIHIGDLEMDESTRILQSQVSVSIIEPESGELIGAATFGVNVDELERFVSIRRRPPQS